MKKLIAITIILWTISAVDTVGQDLSQIGSSDPVQLRGAVGTQNTFFWSSGGLGYRSPFSNNFFMNLTMSLYGFDIPLAFYYSNNNRGFTHPFVQFGMSPRYKSLQLHLGYRSMHFSPYTYSGLNFLGAGVEYNWKIIRVGVFAGTLNQAVDDDPFVATARMPLYKRTAVGAKIGVGSPRNYLDVIFFKAKDDTNSVMPVWRPQLVGLENLVIGTTARVSVGQFLSITADLAGSVFTNDMGALEIVTTELEPVLDYFTPRFSTSLRYAGDLRANLRIRRSSMMFIYRYIQPDYYSLGTSFFNHNLQSLGTTFNTAFVKNRLIMALSLHGQEDNVSKRQLYTNRAMVYNASLTGRIDENFNLTASYNGYNQDQRDGRAAINDSVRISRLMHNISLAPSYNVIAGDLIHGYSGNFNYSTNKNQNPLVNDHGDINTLAAGVGYNLSVTGRKLNLMANWNLQNSNSDYHTFNSNIVGVGASKRLLPDGNLNLSLNSNLAMNQVKDVSRGTSLMTMLGAVYTHNQKHSANLRLSVNSINSYNREGLYNVGGTDMTIGIGYTYSFVPVPGRSAAVSTIN